MIIALQTLIYFRESIIKAVDRLLRPYYKHFTLTFNSGSEEGDDESEDHVFAEFDDEKGVVFYPPVYAQRYAAVSDCLMDERWNGKLEKVVDLGYHDMSFIKYLKEVPGVRRILGVDIETVPLRCSSDLLGCEDYAPKREYPLQITLFQGNAADPDYRLVGCDAVTGIEVIEHMLPHDLDRLVHTVFGFIRPWVVVFTTPNGDFNELFKALERNGLRRLDHFFEWTREQFNDWCSNIVVRYPEYSVSCKGIGPGPAGTLHLGCCSQMAVFTAKNYCKQDDLNINSLALVADAPSPGNISEYMGNWESPDNLTDPMICQSNAIESFTEFPISVRQSLTTIMLSPSFSIPILQYTDKTSQCNLDTELGKSFLMFDNELMFNVVVPRKRVRNRVYVIEDVSSRLNCTTLQVKKFSKTTQNLMAKNKIDSLVHTREVVDEIRYLTKALNFNKEAGNRLEAGDNLWNNINWGDDAPYWNQYYKTVREYNYPFETKSEESRILDLISDEISRMIDAQYEDDHSIDVNRLEIPLRHLMTVVAHVTDDTEKVKDLLEWNGYEVVEDTVIHSRLVVDSSATHEDDWQDNDTFSDWDTADARSTITSDDSTYIPDYRGRCLRRALDQKVRKLRTMMSVDEDITTELDRVVCRLMKLALRSSRGRLTPPPARWMQCKLLDLLTLTEKAIERRKRHFIETYPLKAIEYDELKPVDPSALERIKDDDTGTIIVDKYRHLLRPSDKVGMIEDSPPGHTEYDDFDFLSVNSKEFVKGIDYPFELIPPVKIVIEPTLEKDQTKLERVQAWVDEDFEMVPYTEYGFDNISSRDTGRTYDLKRKHKSVKKRKINTNADETRIEVYKISKSKTVYEKRKIKRGKNNKKASSTKISKKITKKKSYSVLVQNPGRKALPIEYDDHLVKPTIKALEYPVLLTTGPKPIPESLIELCHPQLNTEKNLQDAPILLGKNFSTVEDIQIVELNTCDIAATKESLLIDIVMEENEETIALRRTFGTDAEDAASGSETVIKSISNDSYTKHYVSTENVQSQTIFLNDINEPSTSKGIRHVSMDAQCGPDVTPPFPVPSATSSFVGIPNMAPLGDKINDILSNIKATKTDFGMSTQSGEETLTPRMRSVGIKIRDSDVNVTKNEESSTMTQESLDTKKTVTIEEPHDAATYKPSSPIKTELLKPIASNLNYSISDYYESVESVPKNSVILASSLKKENNTLVETVEANKSGAIKKFWGNKYVRPTLSRGGIHVHSYRDKQTSEDVVFQGEWQRCGPKTRAPKKAYNPVVTKKMIDTTAKRKRESLRENSAKQLNTKEHNTVLKKCVDNSKTKLNKKHVPRDEIKRKPITSSDSVKPFKNIVKVATKIMASSISPKNEMSRAANKSPVATKNVNDSFAKEKKSYIPLYLKKNKPNIVSDKSNLNRSIESVHTMIKVNKVSDKITPLVRSKTQEIKRDLLRFTNDPREDISYIVFRNDIENNTGEQSSPTRKGNKTVPNDTENQKGVKIKRIKSHQSPNSSTCSSPNSIVTVRAACARNRTNCNKRHSLPSKKSNAVNSESDSSSPIKNKKPIKRCRNTKKPEVVDLENNKENIPAVPVSDSGNSTPYIGRHNKVYIAQMKPESSHLQPNKVTRSLSKHRTKTQSNKSNILIPTPVNMAEKSIVSSSSISKRKCLDRSNSSIDDNSVSKREMSEYSLEEHSNMVLVLEPNQARPLSCENGSINLVEKHFITEWIRNSDIDESVSSSTTLAMRQIVEEALDGIESPFDNIDSETVILSRNDEDESLASSMSPQSFKTVVTKEESMNNSILESDLELALNLTFDTTIGDETVGSTNDTRLTPTDLDYISLKSITSGSRYSEYFLADNEFEDSQFEELEAINSNSVREIFERRDLPLQNAVGSLAVQAFSGFSLLTEPVAGDRIDPVAPVDSETGSTALDTGRQAASEELFISGRSSDSYESCLIDEDAVVPHWLFNIISNQHSEVLEESVAQLPIQLPLAEPLYDGNGNLVDTVAGAGAGAGDGRGMHSDHSRDSSGRAASLSSSELSSDPQSEAILMDPSTYTNQFELSVDSAFNVPTDSTEASYNAEAENPTGPTSSARVRLRPSLNASDADADISSIDTDDLPDSSTDLN